MGFKADTSFLRFVTMGAIGVRRVMTQLEGIGLLPIELERYCTSNKIWTTKVKRLRLPDVLCVRTGLRVEVRAKSDLKIRMSDAPANPDRRWDVGLRDEDLVAFIACVGDETPEPADEAVFFSIRDLRETIASTRLGSPKSASEGAERDRTWPAVIPRRDGVVLSVDERRLTVEVRGAGGPRRRQTYRLEGKHAYVGVGDAIQGGVSIIAGAPPRLVDPRDYGDQVYEPIAALHSPDTIDRYCGAKALRFRPDLHDRAVKALRSLLDHEEDERVRLEAAGTAAALGSGTGEDRIREILAQGRPEMRMEVVLLLSEIGTAFARDQLRLVAADPALAGDEIRQAAVWGLGKAGTRSYEDLLPFLGDEEENVALHAIAAFRKDATEPVIAALAGELRAATPQRAAAASEALRIIATNRVLDVLVARLDEGEADDWLLATLGRLAPEKVRARLAGRPELARLSPLLVLAEDTNWLAGESKAMDIAFLRKQDLS